MGEPTQAAGNVQRRRLAAVAPARRARIDVHVEAAQALARRMLREGGSTPADRAARGFRLVLSRTPTGPEIDRLVKLHDEVAADYRADAAAAKQMATDPLGVPPADLAIDTPEKLADLAAWTVVANVILNLDETFMCP